MHSQIFNVFKLRGMDERWICDANKAYRIIDMTWNGKDSWKDSGGFYQVWDPRPQPVEAEPEPEETTTNEPEPGDNPSGGTKPNVEKSDEYSAKPDDSLDIDEASSTESSLYDGSHYPIHSIHWFSQHNGARQWLIWEQQKTYGDLFTSSKLKLCVFDGTLVNESDLSSSSTNVPWRTLKVWSDLEEPGSAQTNYELKKIRDRIPSSVGVGTQYETWGGNLYICNGYNRPLIFNGEYCESVGFASPPPPPVAKTHEWFNTNSCVIGVGSELHFREKAKSKFSRWAELPYSGMGPSGNAIYGAGKYRIFDSGKSGGLYDDTGARPGRDMWADIRCREQHDTRWVGWQYRVTYVNDRGQESEASDPCNIAVFQNGAGKSMQHGKTFVSLDIPIGPAECVARKIYRTRNMYNSDGDLVEKGYGANYYFLTEIQDNMTDTWVDHHPDTALGGLLNESNLGAFPLGTKFLATFKNTMFAAGDTRNTVKYSGALFPEVFPAHHEVHIGDESGGEITGMRATKNSLIVFKSRGIYLIKGDPSRGFFAHTLNKDVGCIAPNSIKEIPGLGLAFLSERGVMLLQGALENTGTPTAVVDLSTTIPHQIELISKGTAQNAVGAVYLRDKEYWLAIPINGSHENNRVLVYHYEIGAWSYRDDFPIKCAVTTRDHRGYLYFGSSDNQDNSSTYKDTSGLCVYSRGFEKKGSQDIHPTYATAHIGFGNYFATVQPCYVMVYAVGMGDNDLEINYEINRSNKKIRSVAQASDQQDPNMRFPVYGEAIWGTDEWAIHRPTNIRYDISTTSHGPTRELQVEYTAERRRIELVGYDLEVKVGEQRRIKPLNEALSPDRR